MKLKRTLSRTPMFVLRQPPWLARGTSSVSSVATIQTITYSSVCESRGLLCPALSRALHRPAHRTTPQLCICALRVISALSTSNKFGGLAHPFPLHYLLEAAPPLRS